MALPIMKDYGINPVVITCDKENIGSAKTIMKNGGKLMEEVTEPDTGEVVQIYHIDLDDDLLKKQADSLEKR